MSQIIDGFSKVFSMGKTREETSLLREQQAKTRAEQERVSILITSGGLF